MTFDSDAQKARVLYFCRRDPELAEEIKRAQVVEPRPWSVSERINDLVAGRMLKFPPPSRA